MVLEKRTSTFNKRDKAYFFFAAVILSSALGTIWLYSQGWQSDFIHCYFREAFDFIGPGCGLTRSLIALMNGQFQKSISYHAFGPIIFFSLVVLLIFSLKEILTSNRSSFPISKKAISILFSSFAISFSVTFVSYYGLRVIARYYTEALPEAFTSLKIWQFLVTSSNSL